MTSPQDANQITHPSHVARQAAWVGVGSVIPGLALGATWGTIRTKTPVLFSLFSGLQFFLIGTLFWSIRTSLLDRPRLQNWWRQTRNSPLPLLTAEEIPLPSPKDRVRASTIAGAATGVGLSFIWRRPRNAIPGAVLLGAAGWTGQTVHRFFDARNSENLREERERLEKGTPKPSFMQRVTKHRWSPMTVLTDEEYEVMMADKIRAVESEIAGVDEKIEGWRKRKVEMEQEEVLLRKTDVEAQES